MNTFEGEAWQEDETVVLIGILKSLKDMKDSPNKLDWQHVANQMAESKHENNKTRSIPDLREQFNKLRNDYFTARYRNRSCQYYNYLHDLLRDELVPEQEHEESEEGAPEVEQKYAHTLQLDYNREHTTRSTYKWSKGEVKAFLNIISTLKLQSALLGSKNVKVLKLLSEEMAKRNFFKRPDQLRLKYNQLKRQYAKAQSTGETFDYFESMHSLLNEPLPAAENSVGEMDSDDSDKEEEDDEEEDGDAIMASESDEDALVASIPSNPRCKWAEGEVSIFLDIITSMGLQTALLRKRNAKIFKLLSKEMAKRCFDKPPDKLRIKFQQLRREYNKAQKGGDTFEHFETMHQLLNSRHKEAEEAEENLSSCSESNTICSEDADGVTSRRSRDHPDTYYWTDQEVDVFLAIIKEHNLFRALDGSKKRNFKTLVYLANMHAKQSYKRTPHQLRNKLRLLLLRYREAKKYGVRNVRMLPRHFQLFDELMQKNRTPKSKGATSTIKFQTAKPLSGRQEEDEDSEVSSSSSASSCDLLRGAGESKDRDDSLEIQQHPTPLEVLSSIGEGQKKLLLTLTTSHEQFLRQQRELQKEFLQEMANIMRQEREATFRMLRELIQPK